MMNASQRLKIKTSLLIALDMVRQLPLREFIEEAEGAPVVRDHDGLPVSIDAAVIAMARCAVELVALGPHALRKPMGREHAEPVREMPRCISRP